MKKTKTVLVKAINKARETPSKTSVYAIGGLIVVLSACQYYWKLEVPKDVWTGIFGIALIALRIGSLK